MEYLCLKIINKSNITLLLILIILKMSWETSARHSPFTATFREYMDHRPVLPEDGTRGFFTTRKLVDPSMLVYYHFKVANGTKIIVSNNIPVEDRERMRLFSDYVFKCKKNTNVLSLISTFFTASAFFSIIPIRIKYLKAAFFYANYELNKLILFGTIEELNHNVYSYYYHKYRHLAVDKASDVVDPRRRFFRPDTSVYYRETPQEIYDSKSPALLHDPAIYYGPHPYDDYENADSLIELNNKFIHGHSAYDHDGHELVLNEKIDIKRKIRDLPTSEDFKRI